MRLNDEILKALGLRWDDWTSLPNDWETSPRFTEFRIKIADVTKSSYGNASLIYIKDPRISRLFPLWRASLAEAGYSVVCIHTHRNPAEVTRSLEARKGSEVLPGNGTLLWLHHILDAERSSREVPRVFFSYSRLLDNWRLLVDRTEEKFGCKWPVAPSIREARIEELLDADLRHHDSSVNNYLADESEPKEAKACLQVMERWADQGEDPTGRETLDELSAQLRHMPKLYARPLMELVPQFRRKRTLEAENNRLQSEHEAKVAALEASLAECSRRAEQWRHECTASREAQRVTERASTELQERLTAAQVHQKALLERIAGLQEENERKVAALQAANARELAIVAEKMARLREEIYGLADRIADSDNALRSARMKLTEMEEQLAAFRRSTSWRVTAPMRAVGRLLKGLR